MAISGTTSIIFLTFATTRGMMMCQPNQTPPPIERPPVLYQSKTHQPSYRPKATRTLTSRIGVSGAPSIERKAFIPPIEKGMIYGKEAWEVWNVQIANDVPKPPALNWEACDPHFKEPYNKNYALVYFPSQVVVKNNTQDFDLDTLNEVCPHFNLSPLLSTRIKNREHDLEALKTSEDPRLQGIEKNSNLVQELEAWKGFSPGWRLISTKLIPTSLNQHYTTMKELVHKTTDRPTGTPARMPYAIESALLLSLVFSHTDKKLLSETVVTPWSEDSFYTRTLDTLIQPYDEHAPKPICVGAFGNTEFKIITSWQWPLNSHGTLVVIDL